MTFQLPTLPYAYDALVPAIDAQTMSIHHTKHHQAYVDNLNKALEAFPDHPDSLEELCATISTYSQAVRNNAWGHWNHSFFWSLLTPRQTTACPPALHTALTNAFWSVEAFQEQFRHAALSRFGSWRAWLIKQADNTLTITTTPNQDNPLMDCVETPWTPLIGLDLWEHAYYLTYQNRRADYINAFWSILNREVVAEHWA